MKVLFQNRFDFQSTLGGDTTQMLKTKEYLEKLNIEVDISINPLEDLSQYDLVHIFNIMRPFETYLFIQNALRQEKKVVLSSIYWDFDEYNTIGRDSNFMSFLYSYFDEFFIEKIKYLKRENIIKAHCIDFFKFFLADYRKNLQKVNLFLPNSINEGELIKERISNNINYKVVYNAVDANEFYLKNHYKREKQCLSVARIDPRKNILNLVKAIKNIDKKLDLYGHSTPLHHRYLEEVKKNLSKNIKLNGFVLHNELVDTYNEYQLHIMPSWLETPGLSQLEAAACGCNILSTNVGSAQEYFGDIAHYCSPGSIASIEEGVKASLENLRDSKIMSEYILDNFIWEKTAKQTKEAYIKVLNGEY